MIFLNGGYLFCCIPFRPNTPTFLAFSTPAIFAFSLLGVQDFQMLAVFDIGEYIAACVIGVFAYAIAAAALTAWMVNSFDAVLDRPDRLRQFRTLGQRRARLDGWDDKKARATDEFA